MDSERSKVTGIFLVCIVAACTGFAQAPQYLSFSQAQTVLQAYQNALPTDLTASGRPTAAAWGKWVRSQDQEIRARLERGEEDTLTNLLRLGVTYTNEERIPYQSMDRYGKDGYVDSIIDKRANDLIHALSSPRAGEGMMELRTFLEQRGFNLKTPEGQKKLKAYLLANLGRMRDEDVQTYQKQGSNLSQQFQDRGISTDSNLYSDYMIEQHLRHLMEKGLLQRGSIRRVAIVGPGLDFMSKDSGSDFYPPQITQPFAVIDTLARLHLADPATVEVETFDISSRVNKHLARARAEAAAGKAYTIQLLADPSDQWSKDYAASFLEYWQRLGDQIGKPATKIPVPYNAAAAGIWNRAVSVRPGVVLRVTPIDMNVVLQNIPLPPDKQFDLVIATNIFVYYSDLERSLARANLATMIKPGGFLVTNEALAGNAPTKLTDALQTKIVVAPFDTEYMYTYARQK